MSFTTTKLQEILLSGFRGFALTNCIFSFGQISKLKKGVTQRKKLNKNFLCLCASMHYVFHNYKFSVNFFEQF